MDSLRIALLDRNPDARSGRRLILDSEQDMEIVFESDGSIADLSLLADALLDVFVIDQQVDSGFGVAFYQQFRTHFPHPLDAPPALLTASFSIPSVKVSALEAGMSTVVSLEQSPEELVRAVHTTRAGEILLDLEAIHSLIQIDRPSQVVDVELSNTLLTFSETRGKQIARLRNAWLKLGSGKKAAWNVSELEGLLKPLGAKTLAELVIRLYRSGVLDER